MDEQYTLCADVGGTFTDVVLAGPRHSYACKVLSTSLDYADAVIQGAAQILAESGVRSDQVQAVVHGTTVATNAVLQGTGPKTALITTEGCRDVLELRRMRTPEPYNLHWFKPSPLVPRDRCLELHERLGADGDVVIAPTREGVDRVVDDLLADGEVQSVAISLLHSYRNAAHEEAVRDAIRDRDGAIVLSMSSEILPEIGEYERTSTTVVDAYVKPLIESYLTTLQSGLAELGLACPLYVTQSSGRCLSVESAKARPYRILESGPAAGVLAASVLARACGYEDAVAFDMGGTTTKASLVSGGEPELAAHIEVGAPLTIGGRAHTGGGYVVRGSAIDVAEIGTGGGSQLWIDAGGQLAVGPRSSGSLPGPVCYQAGGTVPTVTDAAVVLGYVNPVSLAGGGLRLDADAAYDALESLVPAAGATPREVAHNAMEIANSNMARAIRTVSIDRGISLEQCVLIAYGGSGPVNASRLARLLGVREVIVPPHAGVLSAVGMSTASVGLELLRSVWRSFRDIPEAELREMTRALSDQARAELLGQGWSDDEIRWECLAELRYPGQLAQLPIHLSSGGEEQVPAEMVIERFHAEHRRLYGYNQPATDAELGNLRLTAYVDIGVDMHAAAPPARGGGPASTRTCYFAGDDEAVEAPVLSRSALTGEWMDGPLIVDEPDTSVVVLPGTRVRRDERHNLLIDTRREA